MKCDELVAGGFAGDRAPFGLYQFDAGRAVKYLECCITNQLSWTDVEKQVRSYLEGKRSEGSGQGYDEFIEKQVAEVQRRFLPWLDTPDLEDTKIAGMLK